MTTTTETIDSSIDNLKVDYLYTNMSEMKVITKEVKGRNGIVRKEASEIEINGEPYRINQRFWDSIMSRFGFSSSMFKYFDYDEVFSRIVERRNTDSIRVCVESRGDRKTILAASSPASPIVDYREAFDLFKDYDAESISYSDGIITTMHTPRISDNSPINGDIFHNKFSITTPIDGYGTPNIYLALLRQVCSNGLIAMSTGFKTGVNFGKKDDGFRHQLIRVIEGFNSDEGYAAVRARIQSANESAASVREVNNLYKVMVKHITEVTNDKLTENPDITDFGVWKSGTNHKSEIMKKYLALTGDIALMYGIANTDALSDKRQASLNAKCSVYDLINFATEVATHHVDTNKRRAFDGWVGTLITNEYDLEGTKNLIESKTSDMYIAN